MGRVAVPTTQAATARQTESRLRELDRKSAGAASGVEQLISAARHHWHGVGIIDPGGVTNDLTTWVEDVHDDVATLVGSALTLGQPGRWSLWLQYTSDATQSGNSAVWIEAASPALAPWGPFRAQLRDERYRHGGYTLAGNLCQSVAWSGVVTEAQAASPLRLRVMWRSSESSGVQASGEWLLTAHYLGAARLPVA